MRRLFVSLIASAIVLTGCSTADKPQTENFDAPSEATTPTASEAPNVDAEQEEESPLYLPFRAKPFESPWPTEFKRSDSISTALVSTFEYFDERINVKCPHSANVVIQNETNQEDAIVAISDSIMSIFCEELGDDIWLIAGDYPFLKATIAELNLEADEFGGICGIERPIYNTGCALFRTAWIDQDVSDVFFRGLAAHEIFHLVQDSISPDPPSWRIPPGSPIRIPNWITEGSATFFQAALNAYLSPDSYGDQLGDSFELSPAPNTNIDLSKTDLSDGFSGSTYNVGQFATEYLVANAGFSSFMELWKLRDQGIAFSDAVFEAFGMPLEELYAVAAEISLVDEKD